MLVSLLVLLQSLELSDSFALLTRTPLWILPTVVMNSLFALAGYTLARSIERNGATTTLRRTAWRFLPPFVIVIVSSALLAGAVLSARRSLLYFSDPQVWTYLLNIVGYAQNSLPGVFLDNKLASSINDVTWVMPVAYISITLIVLTVSRVRLGSLLLAGVIVAIVGSGIVLQSDVIPYRISADLAKVAGGRGLNGVIAILGGALAYRERARIVVDARIAALLGLGGVVLALLGNKLALENAVAGPTVAIGAAYLALFAGCLRLPFRHAVLRSEPLLWRIFLLAYPVQQFWIAVGPGQQGVGLNLALSVPVIILLARALWYGVELPLLRRVAPAVVQGNPIYAVRERSSSGRRLVSPYEAMRAALPLMFASILIALLTLGVIAIAVFALQRDQGGV